MVYAYIRISTDKQTVENQRFEIIQFCKNNKITLDHWIDETVSGTHELNQRKLGSLLKKMHAGDILICTELSRLGRSLFMILDVLSDCMKRRIELWTVKENYRLGKDIPSQVLAFAFGLSAEIERQLISQRTREALTRLKSEGKTLGHPAGVSNARRKRLDGMDDKIIKLKNQGLKTSEIARKLHVSRTTLWRYLNQ